MNLLGSQTEFVYPTLADYGRAVTLAAPGVNVAALVGHTTLRNAVLADLSQAASSTEIQQMRQLLTQALQQGAFGLSSGPGLPQCICGTGSGNYCHRPGSGAVRWYLHQPFTQ